jgi:hypothetical protein
MKIVSSLYWRAQSVYIDWNNVPRIRRQRHLQMLVNLSFLSKVQQVSQTKMEVEDSDKGNGRDRVLTKSHRVFPWRKCIVERSNHKHNSRISNQVGYVSQNMARWFGRFWHDGLRQLSDTTSMSSLLRSSVGCSCNRCKHASTVRSLGR